MGETVKRSEHVWVCTHSPTTALLCEGCGDKQPFSCPIDARVLVSTTEQFIARHEACASTETEVRE